MSRFTTIGMGRPARAGGRSRRKCEEPSRPFSSPSQKAKRIVRRGRVASLVQASATSISPATPDALSSAPLWMRPIGPKLSAGVP
jgi:hypothetical protein